MNRAESIVEVTIIFYDKGCKVRAEEVEQYCVLGGRTWDQASREIPEEERKKTTAIGQMLPLEEQFDTEFTEDWIAFEFCSVSECHESGLDYLVNGCGWEQVLEGCREDLLKLAPKRKDGEFSVKFLTAWELWTSGSHSYFAEDDFDMGVDLMGKIDMGKIDKCLIKPGDPEPVLHPDLKLVNGPIII